MDNRLRLLLRQFLATGDPEIAVKFTRAAGGSGIDAPKVWLVALVESDDSNSYPEYNLFYSEEMAQKWTLSWIEEWIAQAESEYWDNVWEAVKKFVAIGRLRDAIGYFTTRREHFSLDIIEMIFWEDEFPGATP
ncbi:hypothetical protein C4588_02825 [Candidatus Parcubacteria bacterium]|nr:MAG: hypothetical protein C4588_02825 [Candidatus Parcubacteria bacterium]